jgi:hypothetical protein
MCFGKNPGWGTNGPRPNTFVHTDAKIECDINCMRNIKERVESAEHIARMYCGELDAD